MNRMTILMVLVLAACEDVPPPYSDGGYCDPSEPCCTPAGQFRERGDYCGTGEHRADCASIATGSLRVSGCSGESAACESTWVRPRATAECLDGYDCAGGFLCLWSDGGGVR